MAQKRIIILGSTGSIGRQALEVVRRLPSEFKVVALSARSNVDLLVEQSREFSPEVSALSEAPDAAASTAGHDLSPTRLIAGPDSSARLVREVDCDLVLNALVGAAGLDSSLAAVELGLSLALANKESMVVGGELVCRRAAESKAVIVPVDSEHGAIFQCLAGEKAEEVARIIITGSGGPFRGKTSDQMAAVTPEQALAHPRWNMGPKVTIDSATLVNKGLEVIEARWLFGVDYDHLAVLIHPQSIVHSLVEFVDGSIKAQLGPTDMRLPIQYALGWPDRLPPPLPRLDLAEIGRLDFEEPDARNFPALGYCLQAARAGGTATASLNAANEEAVASFLAGEISFTGIPEVIARVLDACPAGPADGLGIILEADARARQEARSVIAVLSN